MANNVVKIELKFMLSAARALLILATVLPLALISAGTPAAAQVGIDTPDFYNQPLVSPYVDLLRRNDGRDFLRFQRNVVRDLEILDFQRRTVRQERQIREDYRRDIDDRGQQIRQELGPQESRRGLPDDSRALSPFFQPRWNPLTGESLVMRPTGHPVRFGTGRAGGRGSRATLGRGRTLSRGSVINNFGRYRSLNVGNRGNFRLGSGGVARFTR